MLHITVLYCTLKGMKVIGHRGARGLAPENTVESIEAALRAGADGVEIDVRVTSDGVVVLSHDPIIADNIDNHWTIAQHTYDFLHKRRMELATLEEAIAAVPPDHELRIEIKPGEPIEPLIAVLRPLLSERNYLFVVSFDYGLLRTFHAALPGMPLVLNEKWSSVRARLRARKLETKHIQMNQRWLWRGFLRAMQHGGYLITPYTVNSPAQAHRWEQYIEGIITDYPDRFTVKGP